MAATVRVFAVRAGNKKKIRTRYFLTEHIYISKPPGGKKKKNPSPPGGPRGLIGFSSGPCTEQRTAMFEFSSRSCCRCVRFPLARTRVRRPRKRLLRIYIRKGGGLERAVGIKRVPRALRGRPRRRVRRSTGGGKPETPRPDHRSSIRLTFYCADRLSFAPVLSLCQISVQALPPLPPSHPARQNRRPVNPLLPPRRSLTRARTGAENGFATRSPPPRPRLRLRARRSSNGARIRPPLTRNNNTPVRVYI